LQHADLAERANIALDSLVTDLRKNVDLLTTGLEGIRFNERAFTNQLQRLSLPPENLIFVFAKRGLKYWSDNKVLPDTAVIAQLPCGKVYQFGNGWYYLERRTHQTRTLVGLLAYQAPVRFTKTNISIRDSTENWNYRKPLISLQKK
jgi:hypothetical protein